MPPTLVIRPLAPGDEDAAARLLDAEVAGRRQVRLGEVHDVLALPGFVADVGGQLVGMATYAVEGERAELAVLAVSDTHRRGGIGSALIEAVAAAATEAGVSDLWLVTTNDNLDALRLYQRRGFRLSQLRPGAVDASRRVKPSIPPVGRYGIPLRDELVLVRPLP
ncbi:MAG TPA: GNAT family N-acetyltransferase [Acidimicrobiales bacterium]|nr:GNAT family N-acetyltransferase [Acidimicrobiales bacterium]